MATRLRSVVSNGLIEPRKEIVDMSTFSIEQMTQLAKALHSADWEPEDVRLLGQAGETRLVEIRDSLRKKTPGSDIISVIEAGKTELWLAPGQDTGWVRGRDILAYLTETGLLASCPDLDELKAIQAKEVDFFRKYFRGKGIFGWRGLLDDLVPCLCESDGRVVLFWFHLDNYWFSLYPALRRK